jgi:DNA helicase-2/ATP-dependent DNA helicase PcrA
MPDNIFKATADSSKDAELEEQRRLFYVALTRAEKGLYISYYKVNNRGKVMEPSRFVAELKENGQIREEQVTLNEEEVFQFNVLQFRELAPEIEKLEEDFIGPVLEKFVMNVTALNNYLDCPLSFYYNSLLHIPSAKSEAAEFGSAVHYALEQLFKKMISHREKTGTAVFTGVEEMVEDFKQYMHWHREAFTHESYARRLEYGEEILKKHYDTYKDSWNKVALVELNVKGVVVDGIPLKGKLDKVEFNGKQVNVVDYKTGNPDYAKEKLKGPNEKEENGGNYWRQAVFYKLLLDNYRQKDWRVVSTEFDFIEPDGKQAIQKLLVPISDADLTTVKQQIKEVWSKIQARDFYTGCGKEDCHWCNFVKENNIARELHEIRDEQEI